MTFPETEIIHAYTPHEGDMILLPYLDEKTPAFLEKDLEGLAIRPLPPHKEGGKRTIYAGPLSGKNVLVRGIRLDKNATPPEEALKQAISEHIRLAEEEGSKRIIIFLEKKGANTFLKAAMEGAILGGYQFDQYLTKKKDSLKIQVFLREKLKEKEIQEMDLFKRLYHWVNVARDLLNAPPNHMNPETLARRFQELGKEAGLDVVVWEEGRLKKERMNALLAVGQGSQYPPRLVLGEYKARGSRGSLALIGKGITFDTGGYCLKPASGQMGMKYDMAGAAAAFCAACAVAEAKIPLNVTVITPIAENAVSSHAYRTSDIVLTRSGKSVQVDNTDAEGRLILADALDLAVEKDPRWIIDVATLTGACVVALGEDIAGLFGQDSYLLNVVKEAGTDEGELFWELPLHRPYSEELKAEVADIKNIGGKWGGAVTGALFLREFVPESIPWVHVDIAGPAVKEKPLGHLGKGAKGFGVKTLFSVMRRLSRDMS